MAGKIEKLAEQIATDILQSPYELVDVEYVREGPNQVLRFYVDKEGHMSIADCEQVSRQISAVLDEKDPIPGNYMLEVSSPGLDRPLRKAADFEREKGKEVEVKLYTSKDGQKDWSGILKGLDEEGQIELETARGTILLDKKDVALVRLAVHF